MAEGRVYRGQTPAPPPRGRRMSSLSHVRNPASGPGAVGQPAENSAGRGRSVIFWRLPCPHGASFMGNDDIDDIDFDCLLEVYRDDGDDDFEEFIEFLDNQWW